MSGDNGGARRWCKFRRTASDFVLFQILFRESISEERHAGAACCHNC